jgi:hypothetical protein
VKLDESVEVEAPAESVWQLLVDLPRYGEWNPFVIAAESSLAPGDPIRMQVQLFDSFSQSQTETMVEFEPGRRFCYGLGPMPLGSLTSHRCHSVEALGEDRCRYTSHFELSGWVAVIVRALMGSRLERGFAANTAAVKERAEELARASTPAR